MTEPQPRISVDVGGLTATEKQAIFRLILKRPAPAATDAVTTAEGVLILAAGILKGYCSDQPSRLMILSRMWPWIEDDDGGRSLMFNVVDRRYVGWSCGGRHILIDTATGEDLPPDRPLPRVLESVAYNLYELLDRRLAMARGDRKFLWEGTDAAGQTTRGAAPEGGDGLGEPQVLRNDPGAPVP